MSVTWTPVNELGMERDNVFVSFGAKSRVMGEITRKQRTALHLDLPGDRTMGGF
jgi:hypothetical protein